MFVRPGESFFKGQHNTAQQTSIFGGHVSIIAINFNRSLVLVIEPYYVHDGVPNNGYFRLDAYRVYHLPCHSNLPKSTCLRRISKALGQI